MENRFWDLWLCGSISAPAIRFQSWKRYPRWSMAWRVAGCPLFGVRITLSIASGWVIIETQKMASNDLHTGFTLKKNFKIIIFLISLLIAHPQHWFARRSKTLSWCIRQERMAASVRTIPKKEGRIESLTKQAAAWGRACSIVVPRESLLTLLPMVEDAIKALYKNWSMTSITY